MKRLRWFVAFGAIAVVGVLSVLWIGDVMRVRRENRYNYTWIGLSRFGQALQCYLLKNGHLPGPQFDDAAASLSDLTYWDCPDGKLGKFEKTILGGHDMWGRPLRYQLVSPSEAIVTSFGDNGRDDRCRGDDIVLRVDRYSLVFQWGVLGRKRGIH